MALAEAVRTTYPNSGDTGTTDAATTGTGLLRTRLGAHVGFFFVVRCVVANPEGCRNEVRIGPAATTIEVISLPRNFGTSLDRNLPNQNLLSFFPPLAIKQRREREQELNVQLCGV